jgi:hypothetical protein
MLRRVALVRTDVSEECRAFIMRVKRIGELRKTLAVISNWCTLLSYGVTFKKTAFFIVTAVKTSNLTLFLVFPGTVLLVSPLLDVIKTALFFVRFEVFTAVTMKNGAYWDVTPCGSCKDRRLRGKCASIIRPTRIGELGTTLAVTSNRRKEL